MWFVRARSCPKRSATSRCAKVCLKYVDRAPSEPFKNMKGAFTWECRYFSQSLNEGNYLLRGSMDVLDGDRGNAFYGKSFKESLEGSSDSISDGMVDISSNTILR
jgi:hypothetical protein